jgi:hypothetical protein
MQEQYFIPYCFICILANKSKNELCPFGSSSIISRYPVSLVKDFISWAVFKVQLLVMLMDHWCATLSLFYKNHYYNVNEMGGIHVQWKRSKTDHKLLNDRDLKIAFCTHSTTENILNPLPQEDKYKQNGIYQTKCNHPPSTERRCECKDRQ